MGGISFRPNTLSFRTFLPAQLYDEDVGELGHVLTKISEFFGNVTEFASGSRSSPKLDFASTSLLQIWQSIQSDQVVHVMNSIKACFDAVRSALELKKNITGLRNIGVSEEQITPIVEGRELARHQQLEEDLMNKLLGAGVKLEPGRKMELKQQVISSAVYLTRQLENGMEIVVERRSETTEIIQTVVEGQDSQKLIGDLISELTNEQKLITSERRVTETALLSKPIAPSS